LHEIIEGRMRGKPTSGRFGKMMMAILNSNGEHRTEKDGETEKECQKPALQQNTTDDPFT